MEAITQPTASILVFIARKPGISLEEFKSYYEDQHIPLVTPLVFGDGNRPVSWTRNYVERDGPASSFPMGGADTFGHDCVTQVVFRDAQHREASLKAFGQYEEQIAADEEKFMDRSATKVLFITESVSSVAK